MRLYTYFRSSAAYRVRIALGLKGLAYDAVPVHLVRGGGEHRQPAYLQLNPAGLVPALEDGGEVLGQSLAIIEYLEEVHPRPALLPQAPLDRARVRAIALAIACDIHPINNLRVLQYLGEVLGAADSQKTDWYRHWVLAGLGAVEALLAGDRRTGDFCHGDVPGLADCCLVPQVFNARRFGCDLSTMPNIVRIAANCETIEAFRLAAPGNQPDAE
ncbi:MAG TPA: maleylacetoacetate isomerase [Thauera sp.]|uniref:maleylacetoacetate isomerase n=1 Tax=unclassified Thauera TaxID=2609274 RepID=UPI0002CD8EC0|nr:MULTISPECIES: maleylacetoacetate isomerase [unclassified Thauera]HAY10982.1 maleylacetoacetate isomerase [Thauera sp.]ENO91959.1 maleylacetoacetate isomerase [Thauera sp. 28]WBL64987.1 maleylacetoacetate isomerase [Thauera sp. WB-2]HNR61016.1 maleylacetoacetate isomerase [Thauera sp.]HNS91682.1 maleylacetoacetate isomerase [Thauera sp.]